MPSTKEDLYCKLCKKKLGYFRGWDLFFPCQYCDKENFNNWFSELVRKKEDWRFEWGG
jgi:hypothetical protein